MVKMVKLVNPKPRMWTRVSARVKARRCPSPGDGGSALVKLVKLQAGQTGQTGQTSSSLKGQTDRNWSKIVETGQAAHGTGRKEGPSAAMTRIGDSDGRAPAAGFALCRERGA